MKPFGAVVTESGGGCVSLVVDRNTEEYPDTGLPVRVYSNSLADDEHSVRWRRGVESERERIQNGLEEMVAKFSFDWDLTIETQDDLIDRICEVIRGS